MVKTFQKIYFIGIAAILTSSLVSNAKSLLMSRKLNSENISKVKLPAINLNGQYISPREGVIISDAREFIISKLRKEGVKGDIDSEIKVHEITTKESWENIGTQLYKVELDYAWIDGIAIIKNKEVLVILSGMPTESIFLADLDNDCIYEIYTNIFSGSGFISKEILGFNVPSKETYRLSMRMEKDLHLYIENGVLMAEILPRKDDSEMNKTATGKVILKKQDGNTKLEVEVN